ncbi:MAG: hypothetical protein ACI9V1_002918 [Spirosomataceae bacterium]|jgi:hypothetical protein
MVQMKNIHLLLVGVLFVFTMNACTLTSEAGEQELAKIPQTPKKVELKNNAAGHYRLFVDGEEFFIEGAGLEFGDVAALAAHGANSFRTWRTENGEKSGKEVLDEAYRNGLMVFMGIEVGRERHGFNYDDSLQVNKQKDEIREQIMQLKDHPALLGWGIGNELNLHYTNKKVWNAVNDIAVMIHEVDGNHPATTMLAGIGKPEVEYITANCPDLDFLSIQMYGDIINLQQRIAEAGYDGPYMITEWGATGHWEVNSTEWNAPIEQFSTEKAAGIKERYEKAIAIDTTRCIGSFVFLWGQKQERTPTWYGLFTENNEQTEPIDVMHYFWNDKQWPANRAPQIADVLLEGKRAAQNIHVNADKELTISYKSTDADGDPLNIRFEVMKEATDLKDGGDKEDRPTPIDGLFVSEVSGKVVFKSPTESGAYRAFVYVLDGNNHAATANIPFYVD